MPNRDKKTESLLPASDINKSEVATFWYKHSMSDDKEFCREMLCSEQAKSQAEMTYRLMRHLQASNIIEDYADNNTAGFKVVVDGETINNVVRDKSADEVFVQIEPREGDMRVWYMHQFGSDSMFLEKVNSPDAAMQFLWTTYELALYMFEKGQLNDYCNGGGLEVYEADGKGGYEWCEWCSKDGFDVGEIMAMYIDDDCE